MAVGTGREAHPDRPSHNGSGDGSSKRTWLGSTRDDSTDAVPSPECHAPPAHVVERARRPAAAQVVVEARAVSIIAAADERDRIAAELHDAVIHRLFAAGLSLSSATACLATLTASDRSAVTADRHVRDAVAILDHTIGEVRAAVYRMSDPDLSGRTDLPRRLRDVVADMTAALGFAPSVRIADGLDALTDGVGDDLVGAVREAMANVVRHARARSAAIVVSVEDSRLVLDVSDDGIGIGASTRHRGLAGLQERAERHGGTLHVGAHDASSPARTAGTRVIWSVPT